MNLFTSISDLVYAIILFIARPHLLGSQAIREHYSSLTCVVWLYDYCHHLIFELILWRCMPLLSILSKWVQLRFNTNAMNIAIMNTYSLNVKEWNSLFMWVTLGPSLFKFHFFKCELCLCHSSKIICHPPKSEKNNSIHSWKSEI